MADNVTLPGTSAIVATDEGAGGEHVQLVKLALSADASLTPITADADGLEVQVTKGTITAVTTITNAVATTNALVDAAVYIDDADWADSTSKHLLVGGLYQSSPQTITDGDVGPLEVDATGNLRIAGTVTANLSATDNTVLDSIQTSVELIDDTVYVDDADWSDSTSKHVLVGGLYQSSPQTITDGDVGPLEVNATGSLRVIAAANSGVDIGDVDVASIVPGVAATNLGKAEDAAHNTGDTGVAVWGVRDDTLGAYSNAENDYEPFHMTAAGRLYTSADVTHLAGTATVNGGTAGTLAVGGVQAHDAGLANNNPVITGGRAYSALPAVVATGDVANGISDLWGRSLVSHIDPGMQAWKCVNYTTTQTGAVVWNPAAGKRMVITSIIIGSYGTTAGRLILYSAANGDTTYSAGTDQAIVLASFTPSTTSTPGLVFCPAVPLFCTADHELMCTTSANLSVDITVYGYEV